MGLFSKIKNVFSKSNEEEVKKYDDGLKKTRKEFISKLGNLSKKYKFLNEEYFEELEDILIMADIGINTVVKFVDKLKSRVKNEKITDVDYMKEIITVITGFVIFFDWHNDQRLRRSKWFM